jgi:hypothetical protein
MPFDTFTAPAHLESVSPGCLRLKGKGLNVQRRCCKQSVEWPRWLPLGEAAVAWDVAPFQASEPQTNILDHFL